MIVFDGLISEPTIKRKRYKDRLQTLCVFLFFGVFSLPMIYHVSQAFQLSSFWIIYAVGFLALLTLSLLYQSKDAFPKRIVIDGNHITSISNRFADTKSIADIKAVYDHGTFYELTFPIGKLSNQFFCQKDLLIQGTLVEFENLFSDRIIRKTP